MNETVELFRKELLEAVKKLPKDRELAPGDIRILADVASVYTALCDMSDNSESIASKPHTSAQYDISEELDSAEAKYAEYRKSGEHPLLEMARDELRHAAFYLGRARMSPDVELRERLPAYQARLDELERMIREPHGGETHPVL